MTDSPRILVVDNYDSFVFTIVGYLQQLGAETTVVRNDAISAKDGADFDGVLISPGPGTPEDAGVSMAMIEACGERNQPMLRVCLGHQALGVVTGCTVGRAPELLHGKTSQVHHDGTGVLEGLDDPFTATRYHSLTIDPATVTDELVVNGRTESGIIMAAHHRDLPLHGVVERGGVHHLVQQADALRFGGIEDFGGGEITAGVARADRGNDVGRNHRR